MTRKTSFAAMVAAVVLCYCMLSFYQTPAVAQRRTGGEPPFANSVEQRIQTVNHLAEIKELLKEQNALLKEQIALLRSGNLKVVVTEPQRR